ncbi:ATP-binding protein [Paraburkholderia humisilvae]|uniref:Transposon Tn7 transposition protein TnsC n=1 Tax=Paraburkholderia humisilvae TaxID=627669 RepID=A0A6J5DQ89_9BURK|nr:ATP-binding protein [Paraburkholderia humisilvae]CAB3755401.1 Transposon Tn7 transposition protein TnsC [Paraburkholderia humisilvae]
MKRRSRLSETIVTPSPNAVIANYISSPLAEYRGNPFIEALPPEVSYERLAVVLPERPPYDESERQLPSHLRAHCIQRMFQYFEPLGRHFDAGMRLDILMRTGYRKRNPMTPEFRRRLQEIYQMSQRQDFDGAGLDTLPPSMSMTLIGVSGTGKTRSLRRTIAQYPKVIWHEKYQINQIPWLIVECPPDAGIKQLCLSFFEAVDLALGRQHYALQFGAKGVTTPQRILEVANIARIHAIGGIIFDEVQYIRSARGTAREEVLNFFVTLVNLSGTPIVLVGTMAAQELLQADFSKARRGAGLGGLVWTRFDHTDEWDYLMEELWSYQWTRKSIAFSPEISKVFYQRTQGVVDLAVKLYVLSQYRAMITGEEEVTAELMEAVAGDEFKLLKPMLDALASGDPVRIAKYDDLRPLEFEKVLEREQLRMVEKIDVQALRRRFEQEQASKRAQILEMLRTEGLTAEMAELTTAKMFDLSPEQTTKQAVPEIVKIVGKRGRAPSRRREKAESSEPSSLPKEDLRKIVAERGSNCTAYDALKISGAVGNPVWSDME